MSEEMISRAFAVGEVREMAYQFADMYFQFVKQIRDEFGEETARDMAQKVLYRKAVERAEAMIPRAAEMGLERVPENISKVTNVPFLGWVPELGCDHCPYGTMWKQRIAENPWFEEYASLYCDVTDTTIAEVFTGCYSHKLYRNVVHGDMSCEREYYLDDEVKAGKRTYQK